VNALLKGRRLVAAVIAVLVLIVATESAVLAATFNRAYGWYALRQDPVSP
jgi:hypothetical protein